ncbi:MAG: hypothetical protein AVDCRST_MAG24-1271, partial [uncultured Nocardioidaceae bacterium]
ERPRVPLRPAGAHQPVGGRSARGRAGRRRGRVPRVDRPVPRRPHRPVPAPHLRRPLRARRAGAVPGGPGGPDDRGRLPVAGAGRGPRRCRGAHSPGDRRAGGADAAGVDPHRAPGHEHHVSGVHSGGSAATSL